MMNRHSLSPLANNHIVHSLTYADATARTSATLAVADIGRIAIQTDDNSFWILRNHSPLSWTSIVAGGLSPGGDPVNVNKAAASAGTSPDYSRADHKHDIDTASAIGIAPGGSSAEGTATSLARSDHTHSLAAFGAAAGTFCQGNDARLADARTPTGAAGGQLGGSYPNPDVRGIRETSGPQELTIGAIADGQYLVRSGTTVQGVTPPVFGTEFQYVESLGDTTTTSATFQTKLTLATPVVPAGTYILYWCYAWSHDVQKNFLAQVLEDGASQVMSHVQEPQDVAASQRHPVGGHAIRVLTAAAHTFDLQYRTEIAGDTALISQARLTLWRVA